MLAGAVLGHESCRSEAVAVGSEAFVAGVEIELGLAGRYRAPLPAPEVDGYALREAAVPYSSHSWHEMGALSHGEHRVLGANMDEDIRLCGSDPVEKQLVRAYGEHTKTIQRLQEQLKVFEETSKTSGWCGQRGRGWTSVSA